MPITGADILPRTASPATDMVFPIPVTVTAMHRHIQITLTAVTSLVTATAMHLHTQVMGTAATSRVTVMAATLTAAISPATAMRQVITAATAACLEFISVLADTVTAIEHELRVWREPTGGEALVGFFIG